MLGSVLAKRLGSTTGKNLVLATAFTNRVAEVAGILSRKETLWDSSVIWASLTGPGGVCACQRDSKGIDPIASC